MRFLLVILALIAQSLPAYSDMTRTITYSWEQLLAPSIDVPLPKGWKIQDGGTYGGVEPLIAYPSSENPGDEGWYYNVALVYRYEYGLPFDAQTMEQAAKTVMRAATTKGGDKELHYSEAVGDGYVNFFDVEGPNGTRSREVMVFIPYWDTEDETTKYYQITVATDQDRWDSEKAQVYAANLARSLGASRALVNAIEDLSPRERPTPFGPPYDIPDEMVAVDWVGTTVNMPKGWHVTYSPTGQSLEDMNNVKISASPNPDDPDAPKFYYFYSARNEPPDAIGEMNRMIEAAAASYERFEVTDSASFGSWSCIGEDLKSLDGRDRLGRFCAMSTKVGDENVLQAYGFDSAPEDFDAFNGRMRPLAMIPDTPVELLTEDLVLKMDTVKGLLTTREIPPFPALVPVNAQRAPAGWRAELDFDTGEMRYVEQDGSPVPATLMQVARLDLSDDPELVLTRYFEEWGVTDFSLLDSAYIPDNSGLFVEGIGKVGDHEIKIGAMAEQAFRITYVFVASPERFDELGGTSLLGPIFLGIRPDALQDVADPGARVRAIAADWGKRIAEQRKLEFDMQMWSMRTQTETMIHASRAFMYTMSCGGMCY